MNIYYKVILVILTTLILMICGYWHQRADERHGNPSHGNQELLVIRDKIGRYPGELWGKQVHGM